MMSLLQKIFSDHKGHEGCHVFKEMLHCTLSNFLLRILLCAWRHL